MRICLAPVRLQNVSWKRGFQSMTCGCDGDVGIDRGEKEKAVSWRRRKQRSTTLPPYICFRLVSQPGYVPGRGDPLKRRGYVQAAKSLDFILLSLKHPHLLQHTTDS